MFTPRAPNLEEGDSLTQTLHVCHICIDPQNHPWPFLGSPMAQMNKQLTKAADRLPGHVIHGLWTFSMRFPMPDVLRDLTESGLWYKARRTYQQRLKNPIDYPIGTPGDGS